MWYLSELRTLLYLLGDLCIAYPISGSGKWVNLTSAENYVKERCLKGTSEGIFRHIWCLGLKLVQQVAAKEDSLPSEQCTNNVRAMQRFRIYQIWVPEERGEQCENSSEYWMWKMAERTIIMGQASSSILPEFASLHWALQICLSLMVFGRSSTTKFVSLTSMTMHDLRGRPWKALPWAGLRRTGLLHGYCSTQTQWPTNFKRLSLATLLRREGLAIAPRWSYAIGKWRLGLFVAVLCVGHPTLSLLLW